MTARSRGAARIVPCSVDGGGKRGRDGDLRRSVGRATAVRARRARGRGAGRHGDGERAGAVRPADQRLRRRRFSERRPDRRRRGACRRRATRRGLLTPASYRDHRVRGSHGSAIRHAGGRRGKRPRAGCSAGVPHGGSVPEPDRGVSRRTRSCVSARSRPVHLRAAAAGGRRPHRHADPGAGAARRGGADQAGRRRRRDRVRRTQRCRRRRPGGGHPRGVAASGPIWATAARRNSTGTTT